MDRRGFIKGIIGSVSAGTALITLASPAEAEALKVNDPVGMLQGEIVSFRREAGFQFDSDVILRSRSTGEMCYLGRCLSLGTGTQVSEESGLRRGSFRLSGMWVTDASNPRY